VRRDDGLIKTFFRPNDAHYVLRKVDSGLWGEPAIADGFESSVQSSDFADDPQNFYLFSRLEELAMELPQQAHEMVAAFAESRTKLNVKAGRVLGSEASRTMLPAASRTHT
jgi:hypothetical protein